VTVKPLDPAPGPPPQLARSLRGRWLGGVCAGIAAARGLPASPLRAAFAVAALLGGLGVLAYLACWLIIPAEGEDRAPRGSRAVVVLAQACAAAVGLATLAALGAAATIFGFGWVVVGAAALALGAGLAAWPRIAPAAVLLPVAAIVAPSLALAAGGVRIAPRGDGERVAPRTAAQLPRDGYTSGLGSLLVDLRHTALPEQGVIRLPISAGIRSTIVALPHDRCVHVSVSWHTRPFAANLAKLVAGRGDRTSPAVVPFGQARFEQRADLPQATPAARPGPRLELQFESAGGSLLVRDYPDDVDPAVEPDWPGWIGEPEPRPVTEGMPRRAAREALRAWRSRYRRQVRGQRRIQALMRGPCGAATARPERATAEAERPTGTRKSRKGTRRR
jgi:phage shock protein PspC (stress-responsive transcriptional regulator)